MVRKAYDDLLICLVNPQYLYSTDDTICYVFEGKGEKELPFRLVSSLLFEMLVQNQDTKKMIVKQWMDPC